MLPSLVSVLDFLTEAHTSHLHATPVVFHCQCRYKNTRPRCFTGTHIALLCRRPNSIPISCYQNLNLDGLLVKMWDMMALVPPTFHCLYILWILLSAHTACLHDSRSIYVQGKQSGLLLEACQPLLSAAIWHSPAQQKCVFVAGSVTAQSFVS